MLARFVRFREAYSSNAESLYEAEFVDKERQPDREVSVYAVEPGKTIQLCAEHAANAGLDPPKNIRCIDLAPTNPAAEPAPDDDIRFSFLKAAHHVLRFDGRADLVDFLSRVVEKARSAESAMITHKQRELVAYYDRRIREGDPEWLAFQRDHPKGRVWDDKR